MKTIYKINEICLLYININNYERLKWVPKENLNSFSEKTYRIYWFLQKENLLARVQWILAIFNKWISDIIRRKWLRYKINWY